MGYRPGGIQRQQKAKLGTLVVVQQRRATRLVQSMLDPNSAVGASGGGLEWLRNTVGSTVGSRSRWWWWCRRGGVASMSVRDMLCVACRAKVL